MTIKTKQPIKSKGKIIDILFEEININEKIYSLDYPLLEIYQDDTYIKNIVMEEAEVGKYGCRMTMFYRMIRYTLNKKGIKNNFTFKDFDDLLDEGGWKKDAWIDNYKTPIYNVIDTIEMIKRINNKFNLSLIYLNSNDNNFVLDCLKLNIPVGCKVDSLSNNYPDHFVNLYSAITDSISYFFKMKETYKNYDGYDGYWIKGNNVKYYEIIY